MARCEFAPGSPWNTIFLGHGGALIENALVAILGGAKDVAPLVDFVLEVRLQERRAGAARLDDAGLVEASLHLGIGKRFR